MPCWLLNLPRSWRNTGVFTCIVSVRITRCMLIISMIILTRACKQRVSCWWWIITWIMPWLNILTSWLLTGATGRCSRTGHSIVWQWSICRRWPTSRRWCYILVTRWDCSRRIRMRHVSWLRTVWWSRIIQSRMIGNVLTLWVFPSTGRWQQVLSCISVRRELFTEPRLPCWMPGVRFPNMEKD